MGVVVRIRAAAGRSRVSFGELASSPSIDPWTAESADGSARLAACPEIDCVRTRFASDEIDAAERRAATLGVGADRVLIAAGKLSEEAYLRALGATLGVAFEPLDGAPRAQCPLNDERLIQSAAAGMLPLTVDGELSLVVAPRGIAANRILRLIQENPARARRFRFTSAERLNRYVLRYGGKALAEHAGNSLNRKWPMLSAAPPRWRTNMASVAIGVLVALTAAVAAPAATMLVAEIALAAIFLAWLGLRLAGAFAEPLLLDPSPGAGDDALPVYTIIAALYREASSVDGLLKAIERLKYPAEKLDVIIAVEADDHETPAAIAARVNRLPIAVIRVPAQGPRTKPKALNVALPFARGTFTVVYDAEDRPEPNQLHRALQAFRAGGDDLACVQARLSIDNSVDSWLARGVMAQTPQA